KPVLIPEFEFVNLYGTDITAEKAIDKFPNQNPNPVLRFTRSGRMTYGNTSSGDVRAALGAEVGDQLAPEVFAQIATALEHPTDPDCGGRGTRPCLSPPRRVRLRVRLDQRLRNRHHCGPPGRAARARERATPPQHPPRIDRGTSPGGRDDDRRSLRRHDRPVR